jgi:hypothetical protein
MSALGYLCTGHCLGFYFARTKEERLYIFGRWWPHVLAMLCLIQLTVFVKNLREKDALNERLINIEQKMPNAITTL